MDLSIGVPLTATTISFGWKPTRAAGEPRLICVITTPCDVGRHAQFVGQPRRQIADHRAGEGIAPLDQPLVARRDVSGASVKRQVDIAALAVLDTVSLAS